MENVEQASTANELIVMVDANSLESFGQLSLIEESSISRNQLGRSAVKQVLEDDELGMVETLMPLLKPDGSYAGGVHQAHAIIGDRVLQASPELRREEFTVKEVWTFVHKFLQKRGFEFERGFIKPGIRQRKKNVDQAA